MKVSEAIFRAEETLRGCGVDNARHEACWMLEELLDVYGGGLRRKLEEELPGDRQAAYDRMVARRGSGEPLQYVIGNVDFYNVRLAVGPGVLIPRPETEELVELALTLLPEASDVFSGAVCDVCTGSGAIALAIAAECPGARVFGTDISSEALSWAERNRASLGLENATLAQGDLFSALPSGMQFDLITANPPYVSEDAYATLDRTVKDYEPRLALVAGDGGMALLARIATEALDWLRPSGWLVCEIGDDEGARMAGVLRTLGYEDVAIKKDMAHLDRIAVGRRP